MNYLKDRDSAEALAKEIGGKTIAVAGDVSVEADVLRILRNRGRQARSAHGAGEQCIVATKARVDEIGAARLQRMMAVNVVGAFLCAREAIKRMSKKHGGPGGAIVNVSSGRGAARLALRVGGLRRLEGRHRHHDPRAVEGAGGRRHPRQLRTPGFVNTGIHAGAGEPNRIDRLRDSIPMKRGGEPEEVARAIMWLLSEEASYSTGAILDVTGGR